MSICYWYNGSVALCRSTIRFRSDDIARGKKYSVGIGFVTGRNNFKSVVKAYLEDWKVSKPEEQKKVSINLFVAYDLKYKDTKVSDYKIIDEDILGVVDTANYFGSPAINREAEVLIKKGVVSAYEAKLVFRDGYAGKRNSVLYFAVKNKMKQLIFFDDDEFPIACLNQGEKLQWQGQEVLATHIKNMNDCDMTHGHHCGFISPLPNFAFDDVLTEEDYRMFIEAISNDILNWDAVKGRMESSGITYADPNVLAQKEPLTIKENRGMKFISGANLGFTLTDPENLAPFYNPPGARGEDAFLSTCLQSKIVHKIPCYTFHDGFSEYDCLLHGSLPTQLLPAKLGSRAMTSRFLKACIGWIRYKPLLLYITQREKYEEEIVKMRKNLEIVVPKLCQYFDNTGFSSILTELDLYHAQVKTHFKEFEETKVAFGKIMSYLNQQHSI